MTDTDHTAEIERALSEATPGPWRYHADTPSTDPNWHIVTNASRMRVLANIHIEPGNEMDVANASLITAAPEYLRYLLDALKSEREARQQFLSDVSEDMECLPGCDSHGHEEGCPVADPMASFRNLRENLQRAERLLRRAEGVLRTIRSLILTKYGKEWLNVMAQGEAFLNEVAQPQEKDDGH